MAGDTNTVMVDADALFPKGTVVLNGIKTYATRASVEYGVLSASSLVNKVGGPLTGVFEQVINENEGSLPEVEKYDYEDGGGISGWVDGQRVFIGNRKLMLSHKIQSPALDDETQFAIGNKQVVYIAVDSNIIAMMIVTYEADRRKRVELQRLEENGVSILVRTTDANITPDLMTRLFSIDRTSIIMLTGENSEEFRQLTSQEVPRADAIIATKGRIESLMTVISACVKTKKDINFIVALQTIAVILGFVMVAFVACFGVIGKLGSFGLALFEFAWVAAILLVSKLRSR